jgi:hypothetical protein
MVHTPAAVLNYLKVKGKVDVGNAMPTKSGADVEDARDLRMEPRYY